VAGGNGDGTEFNQLSYPVGLYVEDDQTLYIADAGTERIVKWKCGATSGCVVAGGNGRGNGNDQLNYSRDVIVDKRADSLIICDNENRRVMRWPCRGEEGGQTIISNVTCVGLAMDDNGFL
jgi:acetone carboxylase gamma subunit